MLYWYYAFNVAPEDTDEAEGLVEDFAPIVANLIVNRDQVSACQLFLKI